VCVEIRRIQKRNLNSSKKAVFEIG